MPPQIETSTIAKAVKEGWIAFPGDRVSGVAAATPYRGRGRPRARPTEEQEVYRRRLIRLATRRWRYESRRSAFEASLPVHLL